MSKFVDMMGQRFGRLTVIEHAGSDAKNGGTMWLCECDCGNAAKIRGSELRRWRRSCGCALREHQARGGGVRVDTHQRMLEDMRRELKSAGMPPTAFQWARRAWR